MEYFDGFSVFLSVMGTLLYIPFLICAALFIIFLGGLHLLAIFAIVKGIYCLATGTKFALFDD